MRESHGLYDPEHFETGAARSSLPPSSPIPSSEAMGPPSSSEGALHEASDDASLPPSSDPAINSWLDEREATPVPSLPAASSPVAGKDMEEEEEEGTPLPDLDLPDEGTVAFETLRERAADEKWPTWLKNAMARASDCGDWLADLCESLVDYEKECGFKKQLTKRPVSACCPCMPAPNADVPCADRLADHHGQGAGRQCLDAWWQEADMAPPQHGYDHLWCRVACLV